MTLRPYKTTSAALTTPPLTVTASTGIVTVSPQAWVTGTISATAVEVQTDLTNYFSSVYLFNQGPNDVDINMGKITDILSVQRRTLEVREAFVVDIQTRYISHQTGAGTATILYDALR